jgi:hypothetical protein
MRKKVSAASRVATISVVRNGSDASVSDAAEESRVEAGA